MKVFRRKRQRNGHVVKSATFYGYVGGKKVNLGLSDKQDAEAELVRRVRDWQRATVGETNVLAVRAAASRELSKHIGD